MRLNDARWHYAASIFFSSTLLFLLQPMMAKAILPWYGGSAGVWTACMLFFQVVLLLGYLYAYCITRYLNVRAQTVLHVALLIVSALMLPVNPSAKLKLASVENPVLGILGVLAGSIGLPYFVLSTNGPLAQAWYAGNSEARVPYRLFALSNLASLGALLAYPLTIEPFLPLSRQWLGWSDAYLGFVVLTGAAALRSTPPKLAQEQETSGESIQHALSWIALAACASTLWLGVANHLSHEVAAIPFLWVLPLGIYLLSFILCFERDGWYRPQIYRWILPAAWLAMCFRLARGGSTGGFQWEILIFSAALFACCMFCHGELARRKPAPRPGLTFFYLMIAAGGALGAAFVAVAAPLIFSAYLELPIGIAACMVLGLALLYGYSSPKHLARLGTVAALAFVLGTQLRETGKSLVRTRNFHGTLQVTDSGTGPTAIRALYNGAILHGMEFLSPERSRLATTYYSPQSGVGLVLQARGTSNRRVGVIGLGVGTLAAYGRAGDTFRFYEINPDVVQVASANFRFLRESEAKTDVVPGDGRLALEREPPENFDVLVLDAFSGDAIPVHLLTKEAFEGYFRHLRPGGVIAVHVTNKYLDLGSVVRAIAEALQKQAVPIHSAADRPRAIYEADWSLLSEDREALQRLEPFSQPKITTRNVRPWTDEYSNLQQIFK
jgi:spermidine synthase